MNTLPFRKAFRMKNLCGIFGAFLLVFACGDLAAQTGTGNLKAHVNPGRAGVFVDGKYLGPAANFKVARTYAVAAGQHTVKLIDPRYEEVEMMVTITAGK